MMLGLNNLGTAITVLIAVTLTALFAEIIYVLWRRRKSYRPRVRVEPQEPSLPTPSPTSSPGERENDLELELEQQVMKFQCYNGPSRVLFTIKEEEREELELELENGECSAVVVKKNVAKTVSLSEVLVVNDQFVNETTPFSTPCASPPYFTPHSSPDREVFKDHNNG